MLLDCNDKAKESNLRNKRSTPNKSTLDAFQEVEDISVGKKKVKRYSNVSELRKDLDS